MSGGATPSQQTQQTSSNTSSNTGPPSFIQPYLQQGIGDLVKQYDNNPAPSYYPGQTVAPLSANTQAALTALYTRGVQGSPVVQSADNSVMNTLNGNYLDLTKNPYFGAAVTAAEQPQTKQFMTSVLPGVTAQFEGSGRYGSGQQQAYTGLALDSLNQAQANAAAGMANTAYQGERQNQLTAASLAPTLANQDFANIAAMGQAGAGWDAHNQANIDSNIAAYNYNQNAPWNYINRFLGSVNAGYPGDTSTGTSNSSSYAYGTPSTNPTSSILGGILGGAGLGVQALQIPGVAAALGLTGSDKRLKEDIKPVGKLKDGQTVYSYRFNGDPRTQIGLLAQEVERVHPEAVATHPSGYKMVDYARATAPAGGLF
jgi:hypothetical protein